MVELARRERLQVMLTGEELAALDDWRFAKRMPSRAAAVRELLKRAVAGEGVAVANRVQSPDVGILEPAEPKVPKPSSKRSRAWREQLRRRATGGQLNSWEPLRW